MRTPKHARTAVPLALVLATIVAAPLAAGPVSLVGTDEKSVTVRLDVPAYRLVPAPDDRVRFDADGLEIVTLPGRPMLPYATAMIAVPPGARAVVRLVAAGDEEEQGDVRLAIAAKPGLREEKDGLGVEPTEDLVPAVLDGPWPRTPVELGQPFSVRRQNVVVLRFHPFRYDEVTHRLWVRRALTARVEFQGGAPRSLAGAAIEDRHWDPVLEGTVLNFEQGRAWRVTPERSRRVSPGAFGARSRAARGAGTQAFDEDEPEVRVQTDTSDVYALDYASLAANRYPAGVPIAEVSVHRHEFVENTTPSYVTIELPIEVDDADQDGVFGPGDRILVFVQSWAERSHASVAQREWGDGEVVYATRVRSGGLRMGTRSGWLSLALTPLASYPAKQHWERNPVYINVYYLPAGVDTNSDQFHWTEITDYRFPDVFSFETNNPDSSKPVTMSVMWQGSRHNAHITWAAVRNGRGQQTTVMDSASWFGRIAYGESRSLFGSALTEGATNSLVVWGKTNPNDFSDQAVTNANFNWFEATYWRSFVALEGYLPCNNGNASGDYQITASFFPTSAIRVYDVTDSLAPVRLTLADSLIRRVGQRWQVRFQDTSPGGATRRYVVFDTPRTLAPDRYHAVTRRHLAEETAGDYLLIVPEAFQDALQPLADFRASQGLRVVVAPLESIDDEFNGGRKSSYAIKRFIRHAYRNWDAKFVLLAGDGSEDPQNLAGVAGTDWIPTQKVAGPVGVFDGASTNNEAIPSDPWYVWCLECADPSDSPRLHDLFIGRLPVNSVEQATAMVNKIKAYETVTPDQTWRRQMLLLADDQYSTTSFFGGGDPGGPTYCKRFGEYVFLDISNRLRSLVLNEAGLANTDAEVFDLQSYLAGEPSVPGQPDCRLSIIGTTTRCHQTVTPQLLARLNAGRLWWNFQGHANQYVLTHEDLYINRSGEDDSESLRNDGKPFLFTAFSCHPNGFARINETTQLGPSLGEDMVVLPNRGAIASWASSGFELLPTNPATHINVLFGRSLFADPPRDAYLGNPGSRAVLGEVIAKSLLENYRRDTLHFDLESQVGISYILLGDPATRISIGSAQTIMTANRVPVTDGQPVRLHTLGDTLRIEADIVSNVQITTLTLERTDVAGTAVIPTTDYTVTPTFPDAQNGRRYHLTYRTTLAAQTTSFTLRTRDKYGVDGSFTARFEFQTVLRAEGVPINSNDLVSPTANLSLLVISPRPLDPVTELTLTVNNAPQPFTFAPAPGDTSGREWIVSWTHSAYPVDNYAVTLSAAGGATVQHLFRVVVTGNELDVRNAVAFPNPFEDDLGTFFSFDLVSGGSADVLIRVFTITGKLVYERHENDLLPGYHQLPWNGRDAEGQKLANGIYVYRMIVRRDGVQSKIEGRLVKLRKPRRGYVDSETP